MCRGALASLELLSCKLVGKLGTCVLSIPESEVMSCQTRSVQPVRLMAEQPRYCHDLGKHVKV
jgi:hypothetical protein